MKTKIFKTLVLIITLSLILVLASCGKTETTVKDAPANQDKTTQNNDISNEETQTEIPSVQDKTPSTNEQDKEPENKSQDKTESEKTSSDKPDETVSNPQTSETPSDTNVPTTAPTLQAASSYIGKSAGSLAAAIGQPTNKTYVTSCIGDGEDGEWYYPGFTVYTYRDPNGSEKIIDVLGN